MPGYPTCATCKEHITIPNPSHLVPIPPLFHPFSPQLRRLIWRWDVPSAFSLCIIALIIDHGCSIEKELVSFWPQIFCCSSPVSLSIADCILKRRKAWIQFKSYQKDTRASGAPNQHFLDPHLATRTILRRWQQILRTANGVKVLFQPHIVR